MEPGCVLSQEKNIFSSKIEKNIFSSKLKKMGKRFKKEVLNFVKKQLFNKPKIYLIRFKEGAPNGLSGSSELNHHGY